MEKHTLHPAALFKLLYCINLLVIPTEHEKLNIIEAQSKQEDQSSVLETFKLIIKTQIGHKDDGVMQDSIISIST
jgi:hypothetical protein